jgi:hypothetical protein
MVAILEFQLATIVTFIISEIGINLSVFTLL